MLARGTGENTDGSLVRTDGKKRKAGGDVPLCPRVGPARLASLRLPSGETTDYIVEFAGQQIFIEARGEDRLGKDQMVDVGFNTRTMLFYGKSGDLEEFSASKL